MVFSTFHNDAQLFHAKFTQGISTSSVSIVCQEFSDFAP